MSDELPPDDSVDMDAAETAVATLARNEKGQFTREPKFSRDSGLPNEIDAMMDASLDAIPDDLRENAGMAKREAKADPKHETPPATADSATPKAEGDSPKKERDPKREEHLVAIRLAKNVPNEILETASDEQLAKWGVQATELNRDRSVEIQRRTEELKKAQEVKPDATKKTEPEKPTVDADIQALLQASEFDDSFKKPLETLLTATAKSARSSVMADVQPLINGLVETRAVMAEILNESVRRDLGERFPEVVADAAKLSKVEATAKRLWGENGATYVDAAPTLLGRYRACWNDAARLERTDDAPAKEASTQRKLHGLPSAPARQVPKPRPSLDDVMDAEYEATQKRWKQKA